VLRVLENIVLCLDIWMHNVDGRGIQYLSRKESGCGSWSSCVCVRLVVGGMMWQMNQSYSTSTHCLVVAFFVLQLGSLTDGHRTRPLTETGTVVQSTVHG
jgi:hypothetical protein